MCDDSLCLEELSIFGRLIWTDCLKDLRLPLEVPFRSVPSVKGSALSSIA